VDGRGNGPRRPLDAVAAREIKAVTYSEMVLDRRGGEWYAYVVFDV